MTEFDTRSDAALVGAANRGEARAFEALYRRHRDWVVRLARRLTGREADALDVLQDTFAYLLAKLPDLHLTARMTTFLYPVVKHLSIAAARKARRHAPGDDALATEPAPPAAPGASRDELAVVVSALPEAQREVLLMRFVDDLSLQEIALALAVPLGTVKSRLHHALAALRSDARTRAYFDDSRA